MLGLRLRRSPWIVCYWDHNHLIFENYATQMRITADPLCTAILHFFNHWRPPEQLIPQLGHFSPASVRRNLARLAKLSFLEREGHEDPRSKAMRAWTQWGPEAGFFHFATKDFPYGKVPYLDYQATRQYVRQNPQPPFFKRYPGAKVFPLPHDSQPSQSEFPKVLSERRTWRRFSRRPVPLAMIAQLLWRTWGATQYLEDEVLGRLPLKTSPSAGARHPIEAYLVAHRVDGLPQGLYHYASDRRLLERLRAGSMKRRMIRYLGGQWWFGDAAALFLMTAVFPRTMWKYKYARTYRTVLLDAGHLCQTFCLTATWLGLAPFCTAALADSLIERDIGTDGITESVIYAAGVGTRPSSVSRPPAFPKGF